MSVAVIYSSKHGTTYSIAKHISMALNAAMFSVDEFNTTSANDYDTVVLGSPIYNGKLHSEMELFCRDNLDFLLSKKIGLFICGISINQSRSRSYLASAYLKTLQKHASAVVYAGGAINTQNLSKKEKIITRTMLGIDCDTTTINQPAIEKLLAAIEV